MDTQQLDQPQPTGRLPWAPLGMMAVTVFIVVSGEMMPTAVLPALAADLEVSLAQAGLLVSAWAATVVVASFPLTRLTAWLDRPTVIAGALIVFALATLVTAQAGSYGMAMGSRLVAAGATGLLWSTVNAHAAALVPEHRIARATAVVLAGGSLGTVGAIPAGNAVADLVGWRLPFAVLGLLALAAAIAVFVVLRRYPVAVADDDGAPGAGRSRHLGPLLAVAGLGGLVLVAHFAVFTFVAELLAPSGVPTPALLLVFGAVGAIGVAIVGMVSDRRPGTVPVVVGLVMAASLAAVALIGRSTGFDVGLIVVWGMVTGAVGPAIQASLMRRAGAAHRRTAGTLMPVAMNLGIAVGAAAGSGVVDRWSVGALPLLAVVPALLAAAGFALIARPARGRSSRSRVPAARAAS